MFTLNTKPKALPIISTYEHITVAHCGVEKRMALHLSIQQGTYDTDLKLSQLGEPPEIEPRLKWSGRHETITATAQALSEIIGTPPGEENNRLITLNYRKIDPCEIRYFKFRMIRCHDTAELCVYLHGIPMDADHLKYHPKVEGPVDRMVQVYADFLQQLHLCDRRTALECAKSAKEQG